MLTENAKHLDKVISDTNELAEKVSSKVRILDLAKVNGSHYFFYRVLASFTLCLHTMSNVAFNRKRFFSSF